MTTCRDLDLLLPLRAAGALDDAEAARVEEHLGGGAFSLAQYDAAAAILALAKLPPPGEAERHVGATLARETLAELHRREGRTSSWKRAAAAFAAVAAVLLAVLAPAILGRRAVHPPPATSGATATEAIAWQEPDLDTLWSDAGIVDDDASSSASDAASAAVASLDFQ